MKSRVQASGEVKATHDGSPWCYIMFLLTVRTLVMPQVIAISVSHTAATQTLVSTLDVYGAWLLSLEPHSLSELLLGLEVIKGSRHSKSSTAPEHESHRSESCTVIDSAQASR